MTINEKIGAMQGPWTVEGVIVNTEIEALKTQLVVQEDAYNAEYKGYNWIFNNDGTIDMTSKAGHGQGLYELAGENLYIQINGQPSEYGLEFEDGQMLLINKSPLNTVYYVFVKA